MTFAQLDARWRRFTWELTCFVTVDLVVHLNFFIMQRLVLVDSLLIEMDLSNLLKTSRKSMMPSEERFFG